eukprot:TRINITY_DN12195_c0_g1_i1.p1 TRINITY_DN12195_c0_g1~~TRINITY_DN12195_c0_g1_i1.p1  ORF type:complete len:247 (+),score=43.38 TRINITY_DN12195_c0_g1_i1:683-1423(+)
MIRTFFSDTRCQQRHCKLPSGGDMMITCLMDLKKDAETIMEASAEQDRLAGHEVSPSEKLGLALRTLDPNRVTAAVGGVWTGYMGIVLALKYKFAKIVALAHSMGDSLRPVAAKMIGPTALSLTPPEYRQWICPAINLTCKCLAMAVAMKLQQVISCVQSSVSGGLLASRSFLPYLVSSGVLGGCIGNTRLEDTMVDEVLGWGLASAGIYYQLIKGGSVPLLLSPLFWPLKAIESSLQLSVAVVSG